MTVAWVGAVAIADYWIGDPWGWPHPVQAMGWGIDRYRDWVFSRNLSPRGQRWAGVILALGLPSLAGAIGYGLVMAGRELHSALGGAIALVLLASCVAGRSLREAAETVLAPLQRGDLPTARHTLGRYVGRDTDSLDPPGIYRAVLETLSENATDGVMAPWFYGLLGISLGGVGGGAIAGGVTLALAYKGLSTLDSMVGYREAPYTHLGWASARLEDVATWLPCRLTVATIALLSGRPWRVWRLCCRDAPADPSPNAGWSECAYAAALGVQVGGSNLYRGQVKVKPLLGEAKQPITSVTITQGLSLTRYALLLWLGLWGVGYPVAMVGVMGLVEVVWRFGIGIWWWAIASWWLVVGY